MTRTREHSAAPSPPNTANTPAKDSHVGETLQKNFFDTLFYFEVTPSAHCPVASSHCSNVRQYLARKPIRFNASPAPPTPAQLAGLCLDQNVSGWEFKTLIFLFLNSSSQLFTDNTDWLTALRRCMAQGGTLAKIESDAENMVVQVWSLIIS